MNTNLLHIVKHVIAGNGEAVLDDAKRLKAFFADLAKDEPKPLRLAFCHCIETGAYNALKTAPDAAERDLRKTALAQRVRDEHGFDPALCAEALDILEAALFGDKQTLPENEPHYADGGGELQESRKAYPDCWVYEAVEPPPSPQHSAAKDIHKRKKPFLWVGALIVIGFILIFASNYHDQPAPENYPETGRAEPLFDQGMEHFERHEYTQAITWFTEALKFNPGHAGALAYRGGAYRYKDQYDAAIENCTAALDLEPGNSQAYFYRGTAYYLKAQNNWSREDLNQSIADLTEAIRINPNHTGARYNRNLAYNLRQRF
jgi:tetratricopeptide (TPR) repeat protein